MMSERELSQFNRKLMSFVYPASVIIAEYEVEALMKPVTHEYVVVDDNLYKLHLGQYFRYDVRTQLPFFTDPFRRYWEPYAVSCPVRGSKGRMDILAGHHLIQN